MADKYRVTLKYDAARSIYMASAPELSQCSAEGPTRGEALSALEDEIAAQLATIDDQGGRAPVPVDAAPDLVATPDSNGEGEGEGEGEAAPATGLVTGKIAASVTPALHRELLYAARVEGVAVDALVGELLAEALALRSARAFRQAPGQGAGAGRGPRGGDQRGRRGRGGDGGNRDRGRHSYSQIMEDKSSFLEYVRGLEGGGGRGGRGGRGGGRRGGGRGRGGDGQGE